MNHFYPRLTVPEIAFPDPAPKSLPKSVPDLPPEQRDPWFRAESKLAPRPTARLRTKLFPARGLPLMLLQTTRRKKPTCGKKPLDERLPSIRT